MYARKVYFVVIVLILVALFGVVAYVGIIRPRTPRLVLESRSDALFLARAEQLIARFDPDGVGPQQSSDVTYDTEWRSSNQSVISVGNDGPGKGKAAALAEGASIVSIRYKEFSSRREIVVHPAPLAISCVPFQKSARAGESIGFITVYDNPGTPDYTYQWTSPEGDTSTTITPYFKFSAKGQKIVSVAVKDRAGKTANADCSPIIIE